jgi:hypothetical protein
VLIELNLQVLQIIGNKPPLLEIINLVLYNK